MWDDDTGNIYVDDDDNVDDNTLFYKHKLQMLTSGVEEWMKGMTLWNRFRLKI